MDNKGFTLLELLLSLTILAIMAALVFGAFWTGIRSWEKSETALPVSQKMRVVPGMLSNQLISLCLPRILEKGDSYIYLRGSADSLEFFSSRSLAPEYDQDIVYVRYRLTEENDGGYAFSFYEEDIFSLDTDKVDKLPEEEFRELLTDFRSISFSYLVGGKDKGGKSVWQDSWQPAKNASPLPRAVRIEFLENKAEKGFSLIVPVRVEL